VLWLALAAGEHLRALRRRGVEMASRKCRTCGSYYPYKKDHAKCPECDSDLIYSAMVPPDTEWPPEIEKELPTLDSETEWKIVLSWDALEAEARRRGPQWSVADVLAEGWTPA
jgi:hypothetical protein